MILFSDKGFEQRSDVPASDWTGRARFVVHDASEVAEKVRAWYPYYDFVTGADGSLTDVVQLPRPAVEAEWEDWIQAMREGVNALD